MVPAMEMMEATDPFVLFRLWFDAASAAEPEDPNAMTLGTATADGRVSVRVMLMKGYDRRGFVFYTNLASRKAEHWPKTRVPRCASTGNRCSGKFASRAWSSPFPMTRPTAIS